MNVTLYSLPNCGICRMVKTKLQQKQIPFREDKFENIANVIHSDHAPALKVERDNGEIKLYNSPSTIVNWINQY